MGMLQSFKKFFCKKPPKPSPIALFNDPHFDEYEDEYGDVGFIITQMDKRSSLDFMPFLLALLGKLSQGHTVHFVVRGKPLAHFAEDSVALAPNQRLFVEGEKLVFFSQDTLEPLASWLINSSSNISCVFKSYPKSIEYSQVSSFEEGEEWFPCDGDFWGSYNGIDFHTITNPEKLSEKELRLVMAQCREAMGVQVDFYTAESKRLSE